MCPLKVKGRGKEIELCFNGDISFAEAIEELENLTNDKKSFFKDSHTQISYSGIKLKYNQEMRLEEAIKKLFRQDAMLVKKHCLTRKQIEYSLSDRENICLVIEKSLRSGETVISRGDVIIYGDVNPGAYVKAKGNITVIGALRGVAHITGIGKVYAAYMQPSQIRIGKVCSYNKRNEIVAAATAVEENGEIILQSL